MGRKLKMADYTVTHTVIPALPGWKLAQYIGECDGIAASIVYEHIIAWDVELAVYEDEKHGSLRYLVPLTAHGDEVGSNPQAIKSPDGKFIIQGDRSFDDEAALLEHFNKEAVEEAARKAAKAPRAV
jgi:hypothetical protein